MLAYRGVLMLMDLDVVGRRTEPQATKASLDVPVKASLFQVPASVGFSADVEMETEEEGSDEP